MFVPRAVNRKPAKRPVGSITSVKKKVELIPNRTVNTESKHIQQGSTSERTQNTSPTSNILETRTCSSITEKEAERLTESKLENATVCQGVSYGSESSVSRLEDSSTETDVKISITDPGNTPKKLDTKFHDGVETVTIESLASKAVCRNQSQSLKTKPDSTIVPGYRVQGTSIGVSSGIGSNLSTMPINIAAIRKSIDRIKSDRRFTSSLVSSSKEQEDEFASEGSDKGKWVNKEEKDADDIDESGEDEEAVVSYSKNQRWPVNDEEPVCVLCGRYGAYICDQTEVDICSRECKARNLARLGKTTAMKHLPTPDNDQGDVTELIKVPVEKEAESVGFIYREHDEVSELTREQVQEIRAQVDIFVEGVDIPRPIIEFSHLAAPKKMEANLSSVGYNTPTPVQMQVLPAALTWRDIMVCAQTSSGKTAAFLVPTILQIYNSVCFRDSNEEGSRPLGLILSPSRELAMQIEEQAKQLMQGLPNMRTALIVGGLPMPTQLHRLKQDIQLIIATPGRILDIINKDGVSLVAIKMVIIDEVDTMLHKGFQQQVMDVMSHLSDSYQTMLFSATIPPSIEKMAASLLHNPLYISVGTPNTPCTSVKQIVMWVEEPAKKKNLFAVLQDPKHYRPPLVVFVDSKMGAGLLALAINKMCDIRAVSLHGDRPQSERTDTLRCFREGEYPVLVCTAVLGRGIDLPGVRMVVNFDMPNSVEEYIHQIGRTGRLGSRGTAITFINNGCKNLFLEFVNTLKPLGVPLPPQLINSTHLRYQQQGHQSWYQKMRQRKEKRDETEALGRLGGNTSYFGYKRRKQETSGVGELLKNASTRRGPDDSHDLMETLEPAGELKS